VAAPATLFDKIWSSHTILVRPDGATLLHIDRHFVHDGSGNAFRMLKEKGLTVRRPDRTFATPDHYVSTLSHDLTSINEPHRRGVVEDLEANAKAAGLTLFSLSDRRQGIVHVVGPEQGLSQPGMIIVCGDSHTATHGALGALAFGVGASEVGHVLATQALWQRKPKNMRIMVDGTLAEGVHAKDVILAIIARIGAAGGVGHVIEYAGSTIRAMGIEGRLTICNMSIEAGGATGYAVEYSGSAIRALSMEGRLTICNMSIEAGARAGMVAPDDTTFAYLHGRPYAPKGADWDAALAHWASLPSDADAPFDREVHLDAAEIAPMVTWGTSPEAAAPITARVPDPAGAADTAQRDSMQRALDYMDLRPGTPLAEIAIDRVFIGSCTNSRIDDLRAAAKVLDGRRAVVPAIAVPGSGLVKAQAEAEGLDAIFKRAGFEWRESGCSMCVGMNGDLVAPGERCASTSNRNFVGRQGRGARTHLMSPAMAAAAAVAGKLTDVRQFATRP
jgi:3-isopropylmalate/(R)-2-methylmalate dehydratase large subunit